MQKPILYSADAPKILMHAGVVKGQRMTCIHHLHQDQKMQVRCFMTQVCE